MARAVLHRTELTTGARQKLNSWARQVGALFGDFGRASCHFLSAHSALVLDNAIFELRKHKIRNARVFFDNRTKFYFENVNNIT